MHLFLVVAAFASAIAAVVDWRTGEIPNWVSLGALGAGPILHLVIGSTHGGLSGGGAEAGWSLLGALACGFVPFVFWTRGAFGGGDVKMMAAVGALLLPMVGVEAEFYGLVLAAILAPARLAWEGKLLKVLGNTIAIAANPLLPKSKRRELSPEAMTPIRFGPAIFAGVMLTAWLHWRF